MFPLLLDRSLPVALPASLGQDSVQSIMAVFWVAIILLFWTVRGSITGTRLLGGSCAECGSEKYRSSISVYFGPSGECGGAKK